ncbi:uncharacterized protein LOC134541275 [Bacillus rossius redtenbacheri]|uniref:uncharacterized protein LOC134541275 n=1 Tax=Bacillus rossius redtenbacheri TaxID=93214 RepID=UPI002FDD7908
MVVEGSQASTVKFSSMGSHDKEETMTSSTDASCSAVSASTGPSDGVREPPAPPPPPPAKRTTTEYAPAVWRTTVRSVPPFAGSVPYTLPALLQQYEVPAVVCAEDVMLYAGMYSDLRERVALMQETVNFDTELMVRRHCRLRTLLSSSESEEERLSRALRLLATRVADMLVRVHELKRSKFSKDAW